MKINVGLSKSSIRKGIREINAYRNSFANKNALFVRRLAESGIPVVKATIQSAKGDSDTSHTIDPIPLSSSNSGATLELRLSGKDILFIEFGAGIYYNNGKAHPKASQFGYGVGTYPGQKNAINPGYWWYKGDDGEMHLSYGTEATMPMIKASDHMISQIRRIAREVYGS